MEAKPIAVKCPHCDGSIEAPVLVSLGAKTEDARTVHVNVDPSAVGRQVAVHLRDSTNSPAVI